MKKTFKEIAELGACVLVGELNEMWGAGIVAGYNFCKELHGNTEIDLTKLFQGVVDKEKLKELIAEEIRYYSSSVADEEMGYLRTFNGLAASIIEHIGECLK